MLSSPLKSRGAWVAAGLFTVVALVCVAAWLWSESPQPETSPGSEASFDRLLHEAGAGKRFVFDEDDRVVAAGMDGGGEGVLLDLPRLTGSGKARSSGPVALSPGGRRLVAVALLKEVGGDHPDDRLVVLDIPTRGVQQATAPQLPADEADPARGKYELQGWCRYQPLPHWLDDSSFVVALVWYPPEGAHLYRLKFLKYDVARLDRPEEVDLALRRPSLRVGPGGVLLVGDGDEPSGGSTVPSARVLAGGGLRPATADERQSLKHILRHEYGEDVGGPQEVTVRRLSSLEDSFMLEPPSGDWEVRFGGRLVRRTRAQVTGCRWLDELGLYAWQEQQKDGYHTFIADPAGHYRRWHRGKYVGAIPAG